MEKKTKTKTKQNKNNNNYIANKQRKPNFNKYDFVHF